MDDHHDAQVTGRVSTYPAHDGTLVTDLVTRASTGDKQARGAARRTQPLAAGRPAADRLAHR